jgi:hypothetical protein
VEGGDTDFEGGFVTGEKNLEGVARFNKGGSRWKIENSLDIWEFGPFVIVVAEVVQVSKSVGSQKCHFQAIGIECLLCIEAKQCYSKRLITWA